jgi:hypothetical protein
VEIKGQDSQRLVIVASIRRRLIGVLIIVAALIGFFFLPSPWNVIGAVLGILSGLSQLISDKVVVDKLTGNITIRERAFSLIPWQRVIPLSDVANVTVDYQQVQSVGVQGGSYHDEYRVCLTIGGDKAKVDQRRAKSDMLNLAITISKFIGKELVDNSEKPDHDFFPTKTFDRDRLPKDWRL